MAAPKLSAKENRHITAGVWTLVILVVLYIIMRVAGIATPQLVCLSFIAASIVLMIIVPRLSPVKTTTYDDRSPITSYLLGGRISSTSTNYMLIEIVVSSLILYFKPAWSLNMVFYLQAAMLIIYLSFISYFTARPSKTETTKSVEELTSDDVVPATTGMRKADDSTPMASDNMKKIAAEAKKSLHLTDDAELRSRIQLAIRALENSPADSYESMSQVDYQLACLASELVERCRRKERSEAIECCDLIVVLSEQRTALHDQIVSTREKAEERRAWREDNKARTAAAKQANKGRRKSRKKRS